MMKPAVQAGDSIFTVRPNESPQYWTVLSANETCIFAEQDEGGWFVVQIDLSQYTAGVPTGPRMRWLKDDEGVTDGEGTQWYELEAVGISLT